MAEQVTISELELAESLLNDMVIPVETPTKTYSVTLKTLKKFIGTSLPLGCIIQNVGITDDERLTLLDGKTLSRVGTYKDFCDKVVEYVANGKWKQCTENEFQQDVNTYGQCGKFVITNDYVRIPKITRFLGGTVTLSEIGNIYAESLPNITGKIIVEQNQITGSEGAFTLETGTTYTHSNNTGNGTKGIKFNASLSSSSYQDGAKVQPEHTKYPYYMIVSSEGQVEPISVDINKIYEDLNLYQINHLVDNFNNPDSVTYPTTSAVDSRIIDVMNIKDAAISGGYRIGKLIVNWGIGTTWTTCTFAIPFSNTNYGFAVVKEATGDSENPVGYSNKTTTSITTGARSDNRNTSWIAIGY